jgi:hypothetical protein
VPPNTRDNLYQGLPPTMKAELRVRLQQSSKKDEVSSKSSILTASIYVYVHCWIWNHNHTVGTIVNTWSCAAVKHGRIEMWAIQDLGLARPSCIQHHKVSFISAQCFLSVINHMSREDTSWLCFGYTDHKDVFHKMLCSCVYQCWTGI